MMSSRAQALALHHRLLQANASMLRMRLQRDAARVVGAADPAAWMRRAWNRTGTPSGLALLAVAVLAPLRRTGARRIVMGALLAWQLWRRRRRRR